MAGTRLFIIGVTMLKVIILVGCSLYWTIRWQTQECLENGSSRSGHHYVEYCKEHPSDALWNKVSYLLFPESEMDDHNIGSSSLSSSSSSLASSVSRGAVHVEFTLWHHVDNYGEIDMKKNHGKVITLMKESFLNPLTDAFLVDHPHDHVSFGVSSQMGCCLLPRQQQHHNEDGEPHTVPLSSLSRSHFFLDEVDVDLDKILFRDDDSPIQKLISVVIHVSSQSFVFQQNDGIANEEHSSIAQYKDKGFLCLVNDNVLSMQQEQSSLYHFLQEQLHQNENSNYNDYHRQELFERSFIEDYAIGYYFPLLFPLFAPTFLTFIRELQRYKQKVRLSFTEKPA